MREIDIREHWGEKERNLMTDVVVTEDGSDWKRFMRKHWRIAAVFVAAGVLAFVGAVYLSLVRGKCAVIRLGAEDPRSLDNGELGELHSERDFLGASLDWNPYCCSCSGRLAVVEEIWRGIERISPLSQTLTYHKGRWRSITVFLHRILHQGLS